MKIRLLTIGTLLIASTGGAWLAACDGPVLWTGPSDGGEPDAAHPIADAAPTTDASLDSGSKGDASAPADGGAAPDCKTAAWPAMLAAPITPLGAIADLNMNTAGPSTITLAQAEAVNCPATPVDAGAAPGTLVAAWGPKNDVWFTYDQAAPTDLLEFHVTQGYTGTVAFHSRAGGAYGAHQYVIGMNKLLRDGAPFVIDWTGSSADVIAAPSIAAVSELFDGIMATFAPTYPVEANCYADDDCIIAPDDLTAEANDGGPPDSAIIGFRPLKLYIQMPVGTSNPNDIYTFFTGGPHLTDPPQVDAGVVPGLDAGGGVTLPTGCHYGSADLWGSCASPTKALCSQSGLSPASCRDYPQSGYVVTCCPADGG